MSTAALLIDEDRMIAEATGNPPLANAPMLLAAWRGQETLASELIAATAQEATARGWTSQLAYASSVLYNGLGRHDAALDAAWPVFERDPVGYGPLVVPELAEAASRTGDTALVTAALEWLSERTRVTPTDWALGIEARVRALLSEGEAADGLYRESIERLGRTRVRVELARTHLLYGEWLRRERRRVDAREQLRTAHEMLDTMGIEAFAERARRELLATGETARKRTVETRDELTAQEAQIARLARDGLSNPEIGTRLFISPRTVKYHLRKVFMKLDISSRNELDRVLPSDATPSSPLAEPSDSTVHWRMRARPARTDTRRDALVNAHPDAVPDDRRVVDPIRRERGQGRSRPPAEPVAGELFAFEPTWTRLCEHTHLVAVDLPGFGHSQRGDELLSPRAMGEFVIRIADAFGLEQPHVVVPMSARAPHCSPRPCIRAVCAALSSGVAARQFRSSSVGAEGLGRSPRA